jgi:hypothetical protein
MMEVTFDAISFAIGVASVKNGTELLIDTARRLVIHALVTDRELPVAAAAANAASGNGVEYYPSFKNYGTGAISGNDPGRP